MGFSDCSPITHRGHFLFCHGKIIENYPIFNILTIQGKMHVILHKLWNIRFHVWIFLHILQHLPNLEIIVGFVANVLTHIHKIVLNFGWAFLGGLSVHEQLFDILTHTFVTTTLHYGYRWFLMKI